MSLTGSVEPPLQSLRHIRHRLEAVNRTLRIEVSRGEGKLSLIRTNINKSPNRGIAIV